jgi:hypothetical protein
MRYSRQDDGERLKLANNRLHQWWQITDLSIIVSVSDRPYS